MVVVVVMVMVVTTTSLLPAAVGGSKGGFETRGRPGTHPQRVEGRSRPKTPLASPKLPRRSRARMRARARHTSLALVPRGASDRLNQFSRTGETPTEPRVAALANPARAPTWARHTL